MQGMSLSVNAVSEVREFTTTTGRTVYVLDGLHGFDLDALIAACISRACAPPPVGRGGSLRSTTPSDFSTKSGANPDTILGKLKRKFSSLSDSAKSELLSVSEEAWNKRMPQHPAVRVRIPERAIFQLSDSERVKNQHESGTSEGIFAPDYRSEWEREVFGEELQTFPIYGYISERRGAAAFEGESDVHYYGDLILELKQDVNRRTTVTFGDSLGMDTAPLPLSDVWKVSPERRFFATTYVRNYMEAQIHDGVRLEDVARIYVRSYAMTGILFLDEARRRGIEIPMKESNPHGLSTWDGRGVTKNDIDGELLMRRLFPNIEVVMIDDLTNSFFSVCAVHGEFACTSKACAPPPVGRGGSLPSGGDREPLFDHADPEPYAEQRIRELKDVESNYEDALFNSKRAWETLPKNPVVRMRIPLKALDSVVHLSEGKFLTQHETGTSMGFFNPDKRSRAEHRMFSKWDTRPKYGYIAESGERAGTSMQYYGDIAIEFKDSVTKRTTFTVGDSLVDEIAPMRVDDMWTSSEERRIATAPFGLQSYVEAQIHGPLTMNDVARIYVERRDFYNYDYDRGRLMDEPNSVFKKILSDYPDIEIVFGPDNIRLQFGVCEEHGEFSCNSKACAPPPVGRGGSLPTRLSRGVQVEVPVGRLWNALVLGARGDKSALVDLFSEYVMAGNVVRHRATGAAGRSWSTSDDTAKSFAWERVADGRMVGEDSGRHLARRVGSSWTVRIPLVLRGRPEIGKSDDWTGATPRDLNWWAEQEGEVRVSKGARIKLDGVSVALPSRKQLERILAKGDPREVIDIFGGPDTSEWVDLDMPLVLTASVCVEHDEFACTSKACAPPPVGTGGSLPIAVQHVTSREAAALIKSGGFIIGRGQMHGSQFGNGIYLSNAGNKMATGLYKKATEHEGHDAALVKGTVQLKRSLKVSGNSRKEIFNDIVKQLGGQGAVKAAARQSIDRLRDGAKAALRKVLGEDAVKRVGWDGEFETDPVFGDMTSEQYGKFVAAIEPSLPHSVLSFGDLSGIATLRKMAEQGAVTDSWTKSLCNLVADLGFDGIEIMNPSNSSSVGGSQIVVFDPKAITVESVEDFGALIERFGIEVTLDYAPEVFACIEHGEFACTSKACAPPPVGTGGSLKSGSGAVERWTGGEATVAIAPKSKRSLTLDDIHSTWPRDRSEVMKLLGDAEPYPDGYKISTEQDLSRFVVSSRWVKMGESVVPVLRKVAAEVIKDGIDRAASAENMVGESAEVNVVRLHVARVLTAIRSAPKSTVWRGMRVSQEVLDQLKVGSVYSEVLATATGRRKLAENFARGKFGSVGQKRSGTVQVLLKMNARNLPIGGNPTGDLVDLADERFISGKFRVVSVSKVRSTHIIEVEQIDGD